MKILCDKSKKIFESYVNFLEKYLSHILLLSIRIFIGLVFLKSGLVKLSNVDSAILLFEYEYQVPLLPPVLAAYSAMIFEIGCGALVMAGLLTRLSSLPLLGMSLIIQLFVFQNQEHFYWMFLLSTLAIYGGGKLSLDSLACKFCKKDK